MLVLKADRAEMVESLTVSPQCLNVALVAGGRGDNTHLARVVNRHRGPAVGHTRYPGDEGAGLGTARPHGARFRRRPGIAQVNILVPAAEMDAGVVAQGEVAAARAVLERLVAQGGVVAAGGIGHEDAPA